MKNLLEQLQQLAPLAAAATTGPWRYGSSMELSQHEVTQTFVFQDSKVSDDDEWNNAAFIAAARNLLTPENLTLLVAALAGPAVAGWITVADGLPESGVYVALYDDTEEYPQVCAYYDAIRWRNHYTTFPLSVYTHWLAIPATPTLPEDSDYV